MSSTTNKGAASSHSRWCSHSLPISHSNNILSVFGMHYFMSFACGLERSLIDIRDIIADRWGAAYISLAFSYYTLFLPAITIFMLILLIALLVNEVVAFLESMIYFFIHFLTLFTCNYTRMASIYCTSMHVAESCLGKIWHDSIIRLVTPKRPCSVCKSEAGHCRRGECYSFNPGLLFDEIHINCECFKQHLSNRLVLARESDACKTSFEQSGKILECKYLWRSSALERYCRDGCGVFDDDVLGRNYDLDRSMWTSVRLETQASSPSESTGKNSTTVADDLVDIKILRNDLDEIISVPINDPDRLFEMPELQFSFLKSRGRVEGASDIVYTPVLLFKRLFILALSILQVRFASKSYDDERTLAISLMCCLALLLGISSIRERVTVEDMGGPEGRVARMLAVDAMSLGANLLRFSNRGTTWTRYKGYGSVVISPVDILENILHNRSIVVGNKMISLSREGTSMYIADVKGVGLSRRVSGWRRADKEEIFLATTQIPASMDLIIGE